MTRCYVLLGCSLLLSAASGCDKNDPPSEPPPVPAGDQADATPTVAAPEQAPEPEPEPEPPPAAVCDSGDACLKAGMDARTKEDWATAVASFEQGCSLDHGESCMRFGQHTYEGLGVDKNLGQAMEWFVKACELDDPVGCDNAGVLFAADKKYAEAAPYFEKSCNMGQASGCNNAGVIAFEGFAGKQDDEAALALFKKGCEGGDENACQGVKAIENKKAEAERAASSVPGANLHIGSMTVNGFTVTDLSCKVSGGMFMAGTQIVAGLASKKKLKKCGPKGEKPRVKWTYAGGKTKNIEVEDAKPATASCIKKTMKTIKVGVNATCSATLVME